MSNQENSIDFLRGVRVYFSVFIVVLFLPLRNLTGIYSLITSVFLIHILGGTFAIEAARQSFVGKLSELLQIKRPKNGFFVEIVKDAGKLYFALIIGLAVSYPIAKFFGVEKDLHPIGDIVKKFDSGWQWVVMFILVALIGPFMEEVIFRRFLFRGIMDKSSQKRAYAVTCGLFSLIHFVPVAFLSYYLIAVVLQRSMEKHQNLLYPFAIHSIFNGCQVLLIFIQIRYLNHV